MTRYYRVSTLLSPGSNSEFSNVWGKELRKVGQTSSAQQSEKETGSTIDCRWFWMPLSPVIRKTYFITIDRKGHTEIKNWGNQIFALFGHGLTTINLKTWKLRYLSAKCTLRSGFPPSHQASLLFVISMDLLWSKLIVPIQRLI